MSKTEDFLSKAEEQDIVQAIVEAEKNTSGEIQSAFRRTYRKITS
jgi:uncharacterized membrane protein